eukprot:COSAG06_NODE_3982_length_4690_cov_817.792420_4_plen_74_part_00
MGTPYLRRLATIEELVGDLLHGVGVAAGVDRSIGEIFVRMCLERDRSIGVILGDVLEDLLLGERLLPALIVAE